MNKKLPQVRNKSLNLTGVTSKTKLPTSAQGLPLGGDGRCMTVPMDMFVENFNVVNVCPLGGDGGGMTIPIPTPVVNVYP